MAVIDETHDPALRSWLDSANDGQSDFPIQNLPLGAYRHHSESRASLGVAIGDSILDVRSWLADDENLAGYFALSAKERRDLRREWSRVLQEGARRISLIPQSEATMLLPAPIPDYTDFYASIHHATNVGRLFRPDQPLLPNYRHVPIAYHGRASSIVVSGTTIKRPCGQLREGVFGQSEELDYEVELGAFLGPGNQQGEPIGIEQAEEHLVGMCLLNDWSARDIQRWEYQPLGPFLAKNFGTTISPWIVTAEALAPFRAAAPAHEQKALPYLQSQTGDAFDITLEAWLRSANMNEATRISTASFQEMYWTWPQMIAHQASNGCNIRPGDLLGSGTVSGPQPESRGCLLELTSKGREPLSLPSGETRTFLEDGDEVILRGYCERNGFRRIGFGVCSGIIAANQR